MDKNTRDIKATRTSGSGELPGLLNATERAMPVVATAQLVVASRRVRQILLRYISPRYRWASMPSSAALNAFCCLGFSDALISRPQLTLSPCFGDRTLYVLFELGRGLAADGQFQGGVPLSFQASNPS